MSEELSLCCASLKGFHVAVPLINGLKKNHKVLYLWLVQLFSLAFQAEEVHVFILQQLCLVFITAFLVTEREILLLESLSVQRDFMKD